MMTHATLPNPNQHTQCFAASPVRARERQIRAPKKGILGALGRGSYTDDVTVYPYNECIAGTKPIARHAMSHDRICASSVSVVRTNGNTRRIGVPTAAPYHALFRRTNLALTSSYG